MINVQDFIHPDDAAALQKLRSIPALPTIIDKIFQYGYEEIAWSENITSNVRLSELQMPEIYKHLPPICNKLGIPIPELYMQMSPIPNAWTSGSKKVYIVITLGLVRRFKDEELDAVLAHECGHILCQHVLYSTLANSLFALGDSIVDSIIGQLGNVALKPIKQALFAWQRASELSADRVACMITSAEILTRVLARLDGIPNNLLKDMNLTAWARQGAEYEMLKQGNSWGKVVRYMSNADMDHPYGPVRAFEAIMWSKSNQNQLACQKINTAQIGKGCQCPNCHAEINLNWAFCKKCGYKIK